MPAPVGAPASQPASVPLAVGFDDTRPIWRFCDDARPEQGFCVSIAGARELRRRNIVRDRLQQDALAQAQAETAQAKLALTQAALVGGLFSAAALLVGGAVGALVGWRLTAGAPQ